MQKIIHLFFALLLLSVESQGQCDASFTYTTNQNKVSFMAVDTLPPVRHTWLFGDGASANNSFKPVHEYSQPGQYTVLHTVYDSIHSCIDSVWQIITVNFTVACKVQFRYEKDSLPGRYNFYAEPSIKLSQIRSISWTINGVQVSTQQNFSYTFAQPGKYYVCVSIQAISGCTAQKCDSIDYRPYINCHTRISFSYRKDSVQSKRIYFSALPNQPYLKYNWKFGDGQQGTGQSTSHLYGTSGTYNVKLIVTDSINHCQDSIAQQIQVKAPSSDSCTASFSYTIGQQGQVSFTGISNQPIVSQTWTITQLKDTMPVVILNTFNPVYTFTDTGAYSVCLRIVTNTGCKKTYCNIIRINTFAKRIAILPSYPNPVTGETTVRLNVEMQETGVIRYSVSNLGGNAVYQSQRQGHKGANVVTIPVNQLGRGQYFISITYGKQEKRSLFQKL